MVAINIGHQFSRPGLCRTGAALVGGKAQMPCERRLDAGAVEDFSLDGRAINNFLRDQLDGQTIARIGVEVVERANDDAGTFGISRSGAERGACAPGDPLMQAPAPVR